MVDVVTSNAELRARAQQAVLIAIEAAEAEVDAALEASEGEVKVAIVSLLSGLDSAGVRTRLASVDGSVRRAVARNTAK